MHFNISGENGVSNKSLQTLFEIQRIWLWAYNWRRLATGMLLHAHCRNRMQRQRWSVERLASRKAYCSRCPRIHHGPCPTHKVSKYLFELVVSNFVYCAIILKLDYCMVLIRWFDFVLLCYRSALLGASEEWKEFTSKPALKYVLKLLTGLSQNHETTQHLVSAECIPIIHRYFSPLFYILQFGLFVYCVVTLYFTEI